ncbi:MAG: isoprenylcysteine carboxylmethyltransferase family protein [Candidatus Bathyarchaeota archaeon]|nr:MAG: isoprenylcysteine carboxylmethyltransferase family protein [Candidatus Bathyarchaeota archaeon]
MHIWFLISILGMIAIVPVHFLSVERLRLQRRYGKEKGSKIGNICGLISGWGFFIFWIGIWVSPQPRFAVPVLWNLSFFVLGSDFSIHLIHLVISSPLLIVGPWLAINGVKETTLKVAETHSAETVVTTGSFSIVRHPQYFGGLLAHAGISFLFSAWYSLLFTPLVVALVYLISRKEERELIREFGNEYENYRKKVPMLVPRLRNRHKHKRNSPAGRNRQHNI